MSLIDVHRLHMHAMLRVSIFAYAFCNIIKTHHSKKKKKKRQSNKKIKFFIIITSFNIRMNFRIAMVARLFSGCFNQWSCVISWTISEGYMVHSNVFIHKTKLAMHIYATILIAIDRFRIVSINVVETFKQFCVIMVLNNNRRSSSCMRNFWIQGMGQTWRIVKKNIRKKFTFILK